MAFAALFLGSASVQGQILPQAIGQWETTAGFRALERPRADEANSVVFFDTATGATLLDSNTLTDLNIGLGPDIAFSTTREDGMDYELRFFFTTFERTTLTQADSISSPFITGINPREINGEYSSQMFSIELNQKRILGPYVRVLHGLRFLNIDEKLTFDSIGEVGGILFPTPFNATNASRAKNPMLGYQVGAESRVTLVPGLDLDGFFKAGIFNNFASQSTTQTINFQPVLFPPTTVGSSVAGSESTVGFVSDFGCKFHLNVVDNFMSVFLGYDGMYVNGFAPAPANVNLASGIVNDFDFWIHGVTFGFKVVR